MFYLSWGITHSGPVRTWDEADFALALHRFDLLAMQPHFPGYPYFVLGGILMHRWLDDPAQALAAWNLLLTATALVPLYLLSRRYLTPMTSAALAAFLITMPYLWLLASQPMSEASGIAVLWWFLWSLAYALEHRSTKRLLLSAALFGVLMGIRLSFVPFGAGLVYLWYAHYIRDYTTKRRKFYPRLLFILSTALAFQLIWVIGLAASEGGLAGFLQLSVAFVQGHFSEWGGGAASSSLPMGERVLQYGINYFWTGLAAQSWIQAGAWAVIGLTSAYSFLSRPNNSSTKPDPILKLILLVVTAYGLWAFFAQNIEKPRHLSPLVAVSVWLVLAYALQTASKTQLHRGLLVALTAGIAMNLYTGTGWLTEQRMKPSAVAQLGNYMESVNEPLVLYTWEETRVLAYNGADFPHQRIETFELFKAEAEAQQSTKRVFVTDHVLNGFHAQNAELDGRFVKVAAFRAHPIFDPVYADIVLYEWLSP
ncbi:hypothetical protein SY83_12820 [Paenibacillus swuensis]|uniref:Glycosyltransferase RgtA/B/C/D-like domain-containing protein n=1 Tax=Paenibacillus swuensis TaxID=1178515 RepID=A0A172TP89_9BACL|nr:hypothetical protein SY83_12820 [Paenibacillus swuensis]